MAILEGLAIKKAGTLKDDVIKILTEAILANKIKPGERLNESILARQLQISRAPIREALHRLREQGLVLSDPGRGMFVVALDNEDIQRINAVRLVLEAEVLKLCRKKLTAQQERKLIRMIEELESQGEGPAYKQYRIDLEFHRALWSIAGNEYLEKTLMNLMAPLFVHAAITTPPEMKDRTIIISHRWMLEFVQGKLDEPAEDLLLKHMRVAWPDVGPYSSFRHPAS